LANVVRATLHLLFCLESARAGSSSPAGRLLQSDKGIKPASLLIPARAGVYPGATRREVASVDGASLLSVLIALTTISALASALWLLGAWGALRRALDRRRVRRDRRQRERPVVHERRIGDRRAPR
jgi:hypothetical protein